MTIVEAMRDWWTEYSGAVIGGGLIVVAIGLIIVVGIGGEASDNRQCAEIMSHARTSRDSLDASIACASIHEETARTMAISAAISAAGGAVAASASYRPIK